MTKMSRNDWKRVQTTEKGCLDNPWVVLQFFCLLTLFFFLLLRFYCLNMWSPVCQWWKWVQTTENGSVCRFSSFFLLYISFFSFYLGFIDRIYYIWIANDENGPKRPKTGPNDLFRLFGLSVSLFSSNFLLTNALFFF